MDSTAPKCKRPRDSLSVGDAASSPAKFGRKRTRTEQACNNCRKLRKKCNAASPCKACEDSKLSCTYQGEAYPSERLTLSKAVKRIIHLEERLRLYEGAPDENEKSYNVNNLGGSSQADTSDEGMSRALRGINRLRLQPRLPEFYGGSSPDVIIAAVEGQQGHRTPTEDPDTTEDRAKLWLGTSAPLSFSKASAHQIFPILNQKLLVGTFDDYFDGLPTEGKGYEWWSAVMYMTIALGHQYSTIDSEGKLRSTALSSPQDGEACFQLAKNSLENVPFAGGDISAVNCLLLMFLWLYNQQRLHEAYTVLGMAANIGYGIGLHRQLNIDSEHSTHAIGWCASFWCLIQYQRELMALLGRPCAVQAREVDLRPFSLQTSPVELQYLERMRQFVYVTWDSWDQVYSLAFKNSSITERGRALRKGDDTFRTWLDSWISECSWGREPHGIVVRLRFLHVRLLMHRAFLHLVVQKCKRQESIPEELVNLAAECVAISSEQVGLIATSVVLGSKFSGTLQGVLFHALGYLWNAAVTQLLYVSCSSVQAKLAPRVDFDTVVNELRSANEVFSSYQAIMPFAQNATQKISGTLNKVSTGPHTAAKLDWTTSATPPSDPSNPFNIDLSLTEFGFDYLQDPDTAQGEFDVFDYLESPHHQEYRWLSEQEPFSTLSYPSGYQQSEEINEQRNE